MGALLVMSCEDSFELESPPENPWTTVEEFERSIIGAYGVLFASGHFRQAYSDYAATMTSLGDDITIANDIKWGYLRLTPGAPTRTELTDRSIWLMYRGIGTINDALDFVEEKGGNPYPELTAEDKQNSLDRILAEHHFLRGFCYYMLQTMFGETIVPGGANDQRRLPLVTSFASSADEAINPPIATTQQMWDFIRDELLLAKEGLPEQFDGSIHDASYEIRANKYAASAMLMRTYFQRGEYDLAEQEADFLISSGQFDLSEEPIEAFNKSNFAERGRETIFYLAYSDETLFPPHHLAILNATFDGGPCEFNETRMAETTLTRLNWMDEPGVDTEFNMEALRDKRFQQLMLVRGPNNSPSGLYVQTENREPILGEVTLWPWKYYRGPKEDFTNVPVIRLAEVYLTRSIIRFNDGDLQGAADDLNIVAERAWDQDIAGEPYTPVNAGDITAQRIHDERLIELFNEADRLNYLRGLKIAIPRGDRGEGTDPYDSDIFYWPIPESELIFNDNID